MFFSCCFVRGYLFAIHLKGFFSFFSSLARGRDTHELLPNKCPAIRLGWMGKEKQIVPTSQCGFNALSLLLPTLIANNDPGRNFPLPLLPETMKNK